MAQKKNHQCSIKREWEQEQHRENEAETSKRTIPRRLRRSRAPTKREWTSPLARAHKCARREGRSDKWRRFFPLCGRGSDKNRSSRTGHKNGHTHKQTAKREDTKPHRVRRATGREKKRRKNGAGVKKVQTIRNPPHFSQHFPFNFFVVSCLSNSSRREGGSSTWHPNWRGSLSKQNGKHKDSQHRRHADGRRIGYVHKRAAGRAKHSKTHTHKPRSALTAKRTQQQRKPTKRRTRAGRRHTTNTTKTAATRRGPS